MVSRFCIFSFGQGDDDVEAVVDDPAPEEQNDLEQRGLLKEDDAVSSTSQISVVSHRSRPSLPAANYAHASS